MKLKLFIAAALALCLAACAPADQPGDDLIVLTVSGAISEPNRDGLDNYDDALLGLRQVAFNQARAFTMADLAALPRASITVQYEPWPGPVTGEGIRLRDLLSRAGAAGTGIEVQALDGYTYEFDLEDVSDEFILAWQVNGEQLAIGGRGPLWLLMPPSQSPAGPSSDEGLVWAVYSIHVTAAE